MNLGKLEVVRQEMARVNVDILGISKLKWTGMGEFNSDDHYIYYCGQESLRRNGVAITVNKRVQNAVLGCNLKNDRMISVRFKGKPFNITVIQVYAPTSNTEEAEVEWFYEDLQDLLELTPKKEPSIPHSKVRCFLFSIFIIIFTAALLGHLSLCNYLFISVFLARMCSFQQQGF